MRRGKIVNAAAAQPSPGGSGLSPKISLVLIISLIAVVAIVGAIYYMQTSSLQAQNAALTNERNALAANYSQLTTQYNSLLGEKATLQELYNSLATEHVYLQEQFNILTDVIALDNHTMLEENVMVVIPEAGYVSVDYDLQYMGYIEVQYSSPSLLHFTVTYADHNIVVRIPAEGAEADGVIRIPALLGPNVLSIYNDDVGPALVTYSVEYVS